MPYAQFGPSASGVAELVFPELALPLIRIGRLTRPAIDAGRRLFGVDEIAETAAKIANGHAKRHMVEFRKFGINAPQQLKPLVERTLKNPDDFRSLENGKTIYWKENEKAIVILNPKDPDGGTVFRGTYNRFRKILLKEGGEI